MHDIIHFMFANAKNPMIFIAKQQIHEQNPFNSKFNEQKPNQLPDR